MKILYIDMDNVLVDFPTGIDRVSEELRARYDGDLDEVPGIFALMDSVGDREFQQLHMAFVSGQGGARRMILRKFIDEYRRTHKFDGKI